MRWILAWHIIFMVSWFAGLFYLPRLFVYHAASKDQISLDRFKVMEKKLFFFIMTPTAILTSALGIWLLSLDWQFYRTQGWMWWKLIFVVFLWLFHISCGYIVHEFKQERMTLSSAFFRWFNEIPSLLLIGIVILAIVKP